MYGRLVYCAGMLHTFCWKGWFSQNTCRFLLLLACTSLCTSLCGCRDRELQDIEDYHRFATNQANPQLKRFALSLQKIQHTKNLDALRTSVQQQIIPELSKYVRLLQSVSVHSKALQDIHNLLLQAYRDIEQSLHAFVQQAQDETGRMKGVIVLRQKARQFEQREQAYLRELQGFIQRVQQKQ